MQMGLHRDPEHLTRLVGNELPALFFPTKRGMEGTFKKQIGSDQFAFLYAVSIHSTYLTIGAEPPQTFSGYSPPSNSMRHAEDTQRPEYLESLRNSVEYLRFRKELQEKYWQRFSSQFHDSQENKGLGKIYIQVMAKTLQKTRRFLIT